MLDNCHIPVYMFSESVIKFYYYYYYAEFEECPLLFHVSNVFDWFEKSIEQCFGCNACCMRFCIWCSLLLLVIRSDLYEQNACEFDSIYLLSCVKQAHHFVPALHICIFISS